MPIPKDPYMLLSWVNMKLRDSYPTLEELGYAEGADPEEIVRKLDAAGYSYSENENRFIPKG